MLMGNMEQVRGSFGPLSRRDAVIEPRPEMCYFALLAEPNRELTAQANLRLRRVPFWLPTMFRIGRVARLTDSKADRPDVAMALFPRVLFVAADVIDDVLELITTAPGMTSRPFMKFGEEEALLRPVGIQLIQAIEASERDKYFSKKLKQGAPGWMPEIGSQVRFLWDDIMAGVTGTVSEIDDKGRITLLREIFKRTTPIKNVTAGRIEPV